MFLYVAMVFIHIFIMTFGIRWSCKAWTRLGGFLVPVIRSPTPPSLLDDTGVGMTSSSTWKARVSVQKLQGGRVGMTVEEPGRADSEGGSVSKVRPD